MSTSSVTQSLVQLTYYADREQLDANLANNLYQLLDARKVILYKVYHNAGKIECYISVAANNHQIMALNNNFTAIDYQTIHGFTQCLQSNMIFSNQLKNNDTYLLFPITDRFNNIIRILRFESEANAQEIDQEFLSDYIQIYQNYRNLLVDSESDTLTGLLNRRTFDRDLKKILAEKCSLQDPKNNIDNHHQRRHLQNNAHWLAIADIDFFKRVNDDYGHLYGDEVLILLANIMRESFRGIDILFRFGGEEFVIIIRSTNLQGAQNALQRFRTAVETFDFPQVGKVTISIGYVEINAQSIPTEILGHADEALYYSKNNGRNQLNRYEQLVADGKIIKHVTPTDDIEIF